MKTHIILLRGITPKGKNSVLMHPLKEVLGGIGLGDVRTHIQSGSIIASTDLGQKEIEMLVHECERLGKWVKYFSLTKG